MWNSLILPLVLAGLIPAVGFLAENFINHGRKLRANKRLRSNPLVHRGARFDSVVSEASGAMLVGKCQVTALEVGRVEVTDAQGSKMDWTGQGFEGLHPLYSAKQD